MVTLFSGRLFQEIGPCAQEDRAHLPASSPPVVIWRMAAVN